MEKLSKFKKIILLLIVVLSVFTGYSQTKCTVYDIPELKTENLKSLNLVTSITTPKIIRVNIHFILRTNGTGNFTETTDVYGVQNACEFNAGMYLHSLVCDGRIVDTKQMLLTE